MTGKHGGYELEVYGVVFYRGYVFNRPVEDRLYEHIQMAKSPSKAEQEKRIIRGGPTDKDKWILAALEDGETIIIRPVVVRELWEHFDEEQFIQDGKNLDYPLTNVATGCYFQPYTKIGDELFETGTNNPVELRNEIQDWKKSKKKGKQEKKYEKPIPLDPEHLKKCRERKSRVDDFHQRCEMLGYF